MSLTGDYAPSPYARTRDQVELYERTGGREGNVQLPSGRPVIIVTTRGARSGKLRKFPLMRVENAGSYALVASMGGQPKHPEWYHNLVAHPDEVTLQDGLEPFTVTVRELTGAERDEWWARAVEAFPNYAEYQTRTERLIPVFLAERLATS